VYYLNVQFTTSINEAVLESGIYNVSKAVCLQFYYRISTPKVVLDVYSSTPNIHSSISLLKTLTFSEQTNSDSWNIYSHLMEGGITKLRFNARTIGIIDEVPQFVSIDRITFSTQTTNCSIPGEPHFKMHLLIRRRFVVIAVVQLQLEIG
jgi:hypothetical protein